MDAWEYLAILSKKEGWLFRRNDLDDRLNGLAMISEVGNEHHIGHLIPYLQDKNRQIQIATCATISRLFVKIKTQSRYYDALKHCDISRTDIDLFQRIFEKDQYIDLLLIASLNHNGHIRELALNKLATLNSDKAIQFIIYRLGDWVPQVRQAALRAIENFKSAEHVDALVNNLSNFEWLRKVERVDLSSEYESIIQYLTIQHRQYVSKNFFSFPEKNRLLLAKHLSNSTNSSKDEIQLFLRDPTFLIRILAIDHFENLTRENVTDLLNDKSSQIRLKILRRLHNEGDFVQLAMSYLADPSASIREFIRYSLRNENIDFATIYNDRLLAGRDVVGSLMGLAELGAKQFSDTVTNFLHDKKIKVMKTAFVALTKLDDQRAYDFALANLDSEFVGIRKVAAAFLQKRATPEVLEKARSLFTRGGIDLKKEVLKMFSHIGGWQVIPDILAGTVDENREIRDLSLTYLDLWKIRSNRVFVRPKSSDLENAKKTFEFAFELHEKKRFFDANPLQGFGFYLQ